MWDSRKFNNAIETIKKKRIFLGKSARSKEDIYLIIANQLDLSKDTVKSWTRTSSTGPKNIEALASLLGMCPDDFDPILGTGSKSFEELTSSIILRCINENRIDYGVFDKDSSYYKDTKIYGYEIQEYSKTAQGITNLYLSIDLEDDRGPIHKEIRFVILQNIEELYSISVHDYKTQFAFLVIPCVYFQNDKTNLITIAKVRKALDYFSNQYFGLLVVDKDAKLRCVRPSHLDTHPIIQPRTFLGDYYLAEEENY